MIKLYIDFYKCCVCVNVTVNRPSETKNMKDATTSTTMEKQNLPMLIPLQTIYKARTTGTILCPFCRINFCFCEWSLKVHTSQIHFLTCNETMLDTPRLIFNINDLKYIEYASNLYTFD